MIDTLGIRSIPGTFKVSKDSSLEVYPARYNLSTGEVKNDFKLFDLEGEEITGSKSILNTDKYQVTIDARGLYTQLSIPKYARGTNYRLSDFKETKEVINDLERSLKENGISLNINEAIPGRLDGCKNAIMDNPTGNYFSLMRSLNGHRMNNKSSYSDAIKRTGFSWSNTQQEIICYDKRLEIEHRKDNLTGIPKNVLRFEHRLRNGRKIKQALGFNTVNDLLTDFGRIEENYNKVLKETIFKLEPDDNRLFHSRTISDYLDHALKTYKRNWVLHFATNILFSKEGLILDEKTMFEMLEEVMINQNLPSAKKRKQRYRLRTLLNDKRQIHSNIDIVNVRELYKEMRDKLLKVA